MNEQCLIIEGGGFKTGFTSGVLDAFIATNYNPFETFYGVSGGSVAMSYFLANQYRFCIKAIRHLAKDEQFANYRRTFGKQGYMDIDFIAEVANKKVPFNIKKALKSVDSNQINIIVTNKRSGIPEYINPSIDTWIDAVIASCTMPFVTKGTHFLQGSAYFDGGWSDPIPVKKAYEKGVKHIVLLRTTPLDIKSTQSWSDYFGSIYFSENKNLKDVFERCHQKYNDALSFIESPPKDLIIEQIAPIKLLLSGTYTYTGKTIMKDYRYGLDLGLKFVQSKKNH